ncbi:MAG: hypothetical protein KatS3mg110_1304 [Pirellulaceae bacterium]|nr:MAG: hypothetical protein KatS3mg110_1304 [Pirellulaceae bacterium]
MKVVKSAFQSLVSVDLDQPPLRASARTPYTKLVLASRRRPFSPTGPMRARSVGAGCLARSSRRPSRVVGPYWVRSLLCRTIGAKRAYEIGFRDIDALTAA